MTAYSPQRVRVVVGGLHTLAFGVNTTQSLTIVLQELFCSFWCLVLHKGADLLVAVGLCRDREQTFESGLHMQVWL